MILIKMCSVKIYIWERARSEAYSLVSNFIYKRKELSFDITDMFITTTS